MARQPNPERKTFSVGGVPHFNLTIAFPEELARRIDAECKRRMQESDAGLQWSRRNLIIQYCTEGLERRQNEQLQ